MKWVHELVGRELEWTENRKIWELVIEEPKLLREVMRDLASGELAEKRTKIVDNGELVEASKIEVMMDLFRLDFNNKKAMGALLKKVMTRSLAEDFYLKTGDFKTKILRYIMEVVEAEQFGFEVEAEDFGLDNIAKAVNLKVVGDEDDFVELLIDYMTMMAELAGVKLFIFYGFRAFTGEDEMVRFLENVKNHQIDILLVENYSRKPIDGAGRLIIDRDLCEI